MQQQHPGPQRWKLDHDIAGKDMHLRPRNDHIWHRLEPECVCGPFPRPLNDDDGVLLLWVYEHHPLDGREQVHARLG